MTDLKGAERDAAWERFKQMSEGFRSYEAKTDRVIPVLRLTPRELSPRGRGRRRRNAP